MALTFKEILELIDKVAERGISAVEIETSGTKVRVEGKRLEPVRHAQAEDASQPFFQPVSHPSAPQSSAAAQTPASPASPQEEDESGLHIVTSPIVGTFYRAPNPEAGDFVNVGDRVSKGKVLCIIEAMKLMNEIESDADGTVAKIFPQNGQPIEYGEKLFAIRL